MARDDRRNGMWENGFEDISSDSRRSSRSGGRGAGRSSSTGARRVPSRPPDYQIPRWDATPHRESVPDERRARSRQPRPEEPPRKRGRRHMNAGARRLIVAVTVLMMAAVTALLAIFLLFKVTEIQITGDVIANCTNEDVLAICGYKTGDNLFFIPIASKEKELMESFPYVEEAKISRHLPGTVEIHLTGAEVVSCVSQDSVWLYLSSGGKILEQQTQPKEGVMQVTGLSLSETAAGQPAVIEEPETPEEKESASSGTLSENTEEDQAYQTALHNYNALAAYRTVADKLTDIGAAGAFTWLDLSDLSDICLIYRGHIEFKLGSAVEAGYKIDLGLTSVAELAGYSSYQEMASAGADAEETGVMDLSSADENKRAYFTEGDIPTGPATQSSGQNGDTYSESPSSAVSPTPSPTPNPRQEGIPNSAYTGEGGTDGPDDDDTDDG